MKVSILVRTLAPYMIPRLRALQSLGFLDVEVLALGRSEVIREWKVPAEAVDFPYAEVMPGECVDGVAPGTLRRALIAYLQAREPDVLVVGGYGDRSLRAGLIWAIRRKKVTVLLVETTVVDKPRFWAKERVKSLLVRQCDAAFAAGERATQYLLTLKVPARSIWRRMMVVDNDWFSGRAEEARRRAMQVGETYGLPHRYFLYVGRFSPEKNVVRLLEAYGRYRRLSADEPWGLVLVGSGPQQQVLEDHVRKNQLANVVWARFRQIEELPAFYALAGSLVLPSVSEPWGLVVNEAMASGLPVLVSQRCGCVPELVHPGLNGYVFDPLDVDELARLMALMASGKVDPKAMGEESRRIISLYSPEAWARSLVDCVQQTVARRGIPRASHSSL